MLPLAQIESCSYLAKLAIKKKTGWFGTVSFQVLFWKWLPFTNTFYEICEIKPKDWRNVPSGTPGEMTVKTIKVWKSISVIIKCSFVCYKVKIKICDVGCKVYLKLSLSSLQQGRGDFAQSHLNLRNHFFSISTWDPMKLGKVIWSRSPRKDLNSYARRTNQHPAMSYWIEIIRRREEISKNE